VKLSRREFVGAVAAGAAASPAMSAGGRVLHLGPDCVLRESVAGFCGTGVRACFEIKDRQECLFHVVAGAGEVPELVLRQLAAYVRGGGWVIFESAAGFGGFDAQRGQLERYFGLRIEAPVRLARDRTPYVDYRWPVALKVRDFSSVVPVATSEDEIIGTAGDLPVAVRRGRFIFLGSPIGPALLAGDREAHAWFSALALLPSGSGPLSRFRSSARSRRAT
jgi:hypothetical protein